MIVDRISLNLNNTVFAPVKKQTFTSNPAAAENAQISSEASAAIRSAVLPAVKTPVESVETITADLKKLGIEAEFKDEIQAAVTKEAIYDFIELGNSPEIFEGLKILGTDWFGSLDNPCRAGIDYTREGEFFLKLDSQFDWSKLQEQVQEMYDSGQICSNNKKAPIYEGLGRFLYFTIIDQNDYLANTKPGSLPDKDIALANQLSSNAKESSANFHSAYIAARMCKIELPKKIIWSFLKFPQPVPLERKVDTVCNFETCQQAQEYLKDKYGIEAEFADTTQANLCAGTMEDFIKLNNDPKIFDGLRIQIMTEDVEKEYLKAKGYIGRLGGLVSHSNHYDTNNNTLEDLTLRFPGKPETIDELSKDYSSGLHPSANMKQTFDHELAHWLHAKKAPLFYVLVGGIENAGKDLSGRVSGYAQMDIKEFVAEYVTGRMSGATYPKVVDEMYRQFNGPDLKFS